MKLIIKPERGFGKVEVELDDELVSEINLLSERYGVPVERIVEMALTGEFKESSGELEGLERRVRELEEKVWRLEMEYASLRFKAYGVSEDNKLLAIELSGLIAENSQLRRFLRMRVERKPEIMELVSYYMR
ncbi:hypothetical protein [Palaeococcus ferrophilus]|uniref:hypothetical protein n=1 Tax=Palaeococcus ferrophilus TaxID=83868 RepID=UPI00064F6D8C|nr:hypothetical protein [Palaeococcus ferrophilus]